MYAARRSRDWSWIVLAGSALLAALAILAELRRPLNPDAAVLVYSAGRMLRGDRLFVDIIEINPPLIVWLNLPVAWLSKVTGLADATVLRTAVLGLVAASCSACMVLAGHLPAATAAARRYALAGTLFVLLPLTGGMFAQREHLLLALLLPLVALTGIRVSRTAVPAGQAFAVGTAGAVAVALKPHYAAAWLLLVGYRWWTGDRSTRRLLPEDAAVLAAGLAYPVLVLLLTPEYFPLVAGSAHDYLSYGSRSLGYVLLGDSPAIWFYVALAGWLVLGSGARRGPLSGPLAATGLGAVVAIAAQHKGWSYHYLPLSGCAFLLALSALWPLGVADGVPPGRLSSGRWLVRTVYGVLVLSFAGAIAGLTFQRAFGRLDDRELREIAALDAVKRQIGARTLLVLSSQLRDGFPLANDSGLRSEGGYPNMWVSQVYYRSNQGPSAEGKFRSPPAMSAGEQAAFRRIVHDVVDGRPDVLVVESPALNERRTGFPGGFDYLAYLSQDPRCAAALEGYRRQAEVDGLWVLRRG